MTLSFSLAVEYLEAGRGGGVGCAGVGHPSGTSCDGTVLTTGDEPVVIMRLMSGVIAVPSVLLSTILGGPLLETSVEGSEPLPLRNIAIIARCASTI